MNIFSIVVPVFQNAKNLPSSMSELLSLKGELTDWQFELVFVDDGSTDDSYCIISEFAERNPEYVKVIKLTRNFGQNPAIQAGLQYAKGDCVGIISADLQEPCEIFVDMIKAWEQGAKFVVGERKERDESWMRRIVSGFFWKLIKKTTFPNLPNKGYDFCLLDRQLVNDINKINEKNSPIFILLYWFGYKPVCIPIKRNKREVGRSQWSLFQKLKLTIDTLIGFTYLPSRVITLMSLAASTVSILYLMFLIYIWYSSGNAPIGWMTTTGLLLLMGSFILFALGIISEYLLRILDESRKRPPYVVDKINESQLESITKKNVESDTK